jgi:hypothetical protein
MDVWKSWPLYSKGCLEQFYEIVPVMMFCVNTFNIWASVSLPKLRYYEANVEGSELEILKLQNNLTLKV